MTLNKKDQTQLIQVYETWLQSYLNGDVKTYDYYLDEKYRFVGSTDNEEFLNKKETTKFFKNTADQFAGKTNLKNTIRTIELIDGIAFVTELFDAYFLIGKDWKFYGRFRFTSVVSKKKAGWRFIYQHFSMPDSKAQEGETLGAEQISKENQELRDAIKRRTIELEHKNRELEIESSLERVRARAMAMQNSNELSELVDTVFQELTKLDFSLTMCIINIIDGDDKSNTVWATNPETGKDPESYYLKFEDYKFHHGMWKAWKARKISWVYTIEGAEKKTYEDYLFNKTEFKRFSKNAQEEFLALEKWVASFTFSNFGGLQTVGDKPLSDESLAILARFGKVFDLTYTRFNDLKQAEEQAREAQIETALEKVRSRSLAMHKSDELSDVIIEVRSKFQELDISMESRVAVVVVFDKNSRDFNQWVASPDFANIYISTPYFKNPILEDFWTAKEGGVDFYSNSYSLEIKNSYFKYFFEHSIYKNIEGLEEQKKWIFKQEFYTYSPAIEKNSSIGIADFSGKVLSESEIKIVKRFAKVFEQAYVRFLDLQKAEEQAREAQIEAALERVRSRSMAMHKSEELKEVIQLVYEQFIHLNIHIEHTGFIIDYKVNDDMHIWLADKQKIPTQVTLPYFDTPHWNSFVEAKKKGIDFFVNKFSFTEKNKFYKKLFKYIPDLSEEAKEFYLTCPGLAASTVLIDNIGLYIENFDGIPYTEEENSILMRFGKVFQQTYTRFLDLQKAEEQAREAQIEVALERLRSKTMAMHKSEELLGTANLLYTEFRKLGITQYFTCGFVIVDEENDAQHVWVTNMDGEIFESFKLPLTGDPVFKRRYEKWQQKVPFFYQKVGGTKLKKHLAFAIPHFGSEEAEDMVANQFPDPTFFYMANFSHGYLHIVGDSKLTDEEEELLARFTRVFEQTYTRFLDLQKAEEQAREAKIEAALEKVRSRSLAMHKSDEVGEVANILLNKLQELDATIDNEAIIMVHPKKPSRKSIMWLAAPELYESAISFYLPYMGHTLDRSLWDAIDRQVEYFTKKFSHKVKNEWFNWAFEHSDFKLLPEERKKFVLDSEDYRYSVAIEKNTSILIPCHTGKSLTEAQIEIIKRFARVFEQAYIRFLDLQKAEELTREAKIEAALEKVRSRTMAMQHSDELPEAANVLFLEIQKLDIPAWSAGYCIWEDNQKSAWCNMSSEGEIQKGFSLPTIGEGYDFYKPLKNKESFYVSELGGKKLVKHYDFMKKLPVVGEILEEFDKKGIALPTFQIFHIVYFSKGYLMFITYEPVPDAHDIFKRFTSVFEQTYTRFLDLKKAEAQAREAQLEAAMERIRSQVTAMTASADLLDIVVAMRSEFVKLGHEAHYFWHMRWLPEMYEKAMTSGDGTRIGTVMELPRGFHENPAMIGWENNKEPVAVFPYDAEGAVDYVDKMIRLGNFQEIDHNTPGPDDIRAIGGITFIMARTTHGEIGYSLPGVVENPPTESLNTLIRFAKAFDLAYKRFEDLKSTERQTREAKIELALERVRARSLAMHKSEELLNVIKVVSEQLSELDFRFDNVSFGRNNQKNDFNFWLAIKGHPDPVQIHVPYIDTPVLGSLIEAYKKDVSFLTNTFTLEENKVWSQHMIKHVDFSFLSKAERNHIQNSSFTRSTAILPNIQLFLGKYESTPYTDEENKIIVRFAQVFDQSYTRFLDLQKAEAQAREAQIEASLERVRSKTMAMHSSKDVGETVVTLFNEVLKLGLDKSIRCGIGILEDNEGMETWSANFLPNGEVNLKMGMLNMTIHPLLIQVKKAWNKGESAFSYKLIGNDVARYYKALNDEPDYPFNADLDTLPEKVFHNSFCFSEGVLFAFTSIPISQEAVKVLKRFTAVFEQTYTRFLDLKKAEAQTKEAQIEASLERVRSKAMAMHNSEDLVITASQLFKEFQYLEIPFIRCGVLKIDGNRNAEVYSYSLTKENEAIAVFGDINLSGHELMDNVFRHWKLQKEYVHELKGEALKRYYQLLNKQVDTPKMHLDKSHFSYTFYFPEGCLYCFSSEKLSEEVLLILRKFNTVMGLTYRRYFELQEAEARELAAIKESSLDRVRAEIASMRTADDLNRITPIVWKELTILGVPFFRCGVFIIDIEIQKVHAYLSAPSGESLAVLELEFDSTPLVKGALSHWKKQKVYVEKWNKAQFVEFTEPLIEQGQINSNKKYQGGLDAPEQLVLQMVPFKQGMLYVGSEDSLTKDHISMVESLTKAFSVAYTRYEDFKELEAAKSSAENALTELKSTQTQLIQSEKMASLGELTAGIAHEIQNPLNFVNNFSELSEEMLEELEAEIKDNSDGMVTEIMTDLKQNLNKITNHGKRASSIVKGMLEHSRSSSGIKELTDINALADEFLRLSYHGLRAKDKTFNAAFKTDFDTSLPKINVIAQDLGRVILNLINNAFYACAERSRSTSSKDYKPTVTVSTKKTGDNIEIRVKDNGSGIPDKIKDKIFQPFFTTKPTGSGTGLGLSMSYDIITKGHGGELKVESKENACQPADQAGTEFTIYLPL